MDTVWIYKNISKKHYSTLAQKSNIYEFLQYFDIRNSSDKVTYDIMVPPLQDFFTFYGLYHLWYEKGSGKEVYGYEPTTILPYRKRKAIDDEFERIVNTLSEKLSECIWHCIKLEFRYFLLGSEGCDIDLISRKDIAKYYGDNWDRDRNCDDEALTNLINKILIKENNWDEDVVKEYFKGSSYITITHIDNLYRQGLISLQGICNIFNLKNIWLPYYGKKSWGKACLVLDDLNKSKTLRDKIFNIDRAFDLQHNTGCLFNKDDSYFQPLSKRFLNRRSEFIRLEQFLPYCQPRTQKLMIANLS